MTSMIEETSSSMAAAGESPSTPIRQSSLRTSMDVVRSPLLHTSLPPLQPTPTTVPMPGASTTLAELADTEVQHLLALTLTAMRMRGLPIPREMSSSSLSKNDCK